MLFFIENVLSTGFAVLQHWHVLTWFQMRHKWLCAELVKLPSMHCFCTVRACKKIHKLAPLETPIKVVRKSNGLGFPWGGLTQTWCQSDSCMEQSCAAFTTKPAWEPNDSCVGQT